MSMDDPFGDPRDLLRQAGIAMQESSEASEKAIIAGEEYVETLQRTQQTRQQNITAASQSLTTIYSNMQTAQENIVEAERYPDVISDLIGIFDEDYNVDYQAARIKNEQFKAQRVQADLTRKDKILTDTQNIAQSRFQTHAAASRLSAAYASDRLTFMTQALRIPEEERRALTAEITNMSTEDLQAGLTNDPNAPERVKELMASAPGLIETAYTDRTMTATQAGLQQMAMQQQQTTAALQQLTDEQLRKIEKQNSLEGLPAEIKANVSVAQAEEEMRRRALRDTILDIRNLEERTGEMALRQELKKEYLTTQSTETLRSNIEGKGARESVEIDGISYTVSEVQAAISAKEDVQLERAMNAFETRSKIASNQSDMQMVNRIDTDAHVASNMKARLDAQMTAVGALASVIETTPPESIQNRTATAQLAALTESINKEADAILDNYVKSHPDDYQDAARQYAETGTVETFSDAAAVLNGEALNPRFGSGRPLYTDIMAEISAGLSEVRSVDSQKATVMIRDADGKVVGVGQRDERDPTLVVRDTIESNQIGAHFSTYLFQYSSAEVGKTLVKQAPQIWGQIFQSDGSFNQIVYDKDPETGKDRFSYPRLLQLLDAVNQRAIDRGLMDGADKHLAMIYRDQMYAYGQSANFAAMVTPQNLDEAAVLKSVANNSPQNMMYSRLAPLGTDFITAASAAVGELQKVIDKRTAMQQVEKIPMPVTTGTMPFVFNEQYLTPAVPELNEFEETLQQILPPTGQ